MSTWKIRLLAGKTAKLKGPLTDAWGKALIQLGSWLEKDFVNTLIFGGRGIVGIAQTDLYKWITSPQGLSELGIPPSEPPKLLQAYKTSFKVDVRSKSLGFYFGNIAALIKGTPHPANDTGKLRIKSWMRWVKDDSGGPGQDVNDAGFVPRSKLNATSSKFIRLSSPLGGLMLSKGRIDSTGTWSVPVSFKTYDEAWFNQNKTAIESAIGNRMEELFMGALLSG